jgi:hypothetical protein
MSPRRVERTLRAKYPRQAARNPKVLVRMVDLVVLEEGDDSPIATTPVRRVERG